MPGAGRLGGAGRRRPSPRRRRDAPAGAPARAPVGRVRERAGGLTLARTGRDRQLGPASTPPRSDLGSARLHRRRRPPPAPSGSAAKKKKPAQSTSPAPSSTPTGLATDGPLPQLTGLGGSLQAQLAAAVKATPPPPGVQATILLSDGESWSGAAGLADVATGVGDDHGRHLRRGEHHQDVRGRGDHASGPGRHGATWTTL